MLKTPAENPEKTGFFQEKIEPKNPLQEIFSEMGLTNVRPSDALLESWGMSPSRFNQLLGNKGQLPITVVESKQLIKWLQAHFQGLPTTAYCG